MSGSGGGQPANTTQTSIPDWARPYATNMLTASQGQVYNMAPNAAGDGFDILGLKPYQQYQGPLVAGSTGLQNESYANAANMGTPGQFDQGSNLAQRTGLASLNMADRNAGAGYNPNSFDAGQWDSGAMKQYMNPYTQGVIDVQKNQAMRDAAIQANAQNAKLTQAGSYGGSRQAIMGAELQKNLGANLANIEAQGLNSAYDRALQAYQTDAQRDLAAQQAGEQSRQFGANLALQGNQQQLGALQAANQSAATLGGLGTAQNQAQMGIADLQNKFGTQQQQNTQQYYDALQQQYANAQNYPFKQLGFLSDMLHGLPLSANTSVYQAAPSSASQLAGLGLAGLGLSRNMS